MRYKKVLVLAGKYQYDFFKRKALIEKFNFDCDRGIKILYRADQMYGYASRDILLIVVNHGKGVRQRDYDEAIQIALHRKYHIIHVDDNVSKEDFDLTLKQCQNS